MSTGRWIDRKSVTKRSAVSEADGTTSMSQRLSESASALPPLPLPPKSTDTLADDKGQPPPPVPAFRNA